MDPKRIIYYNEYSGFTESCAPSDVLRCKTISTSYGEFKSSAVTQKFLLDESFQFSIHESSINMQDFLAGKPKKKQGRQLYKAIFELEERTDTSIIARLVQKEGDKDEVYIGRIQFLKKRECYNKLCERRCGY